MGGFMNHVAEMDADAMIYIPSLIKIGSGIRKWMRVGINRHRNCKAIA
jgi:hypothetical protein